MSVTLDSKLVIAAPAPIAAVIELVRALVEQRIVRGSPTLFTGASACELPLSLIARAPENDLATVITALEDVGDGDDVCVCFPAIDATHPEYAFYYAEPRECVVAVVRLHAPIEHHGETSVDDDPDRPPRQEARVVLGATWIELVGREAPYEGELRGSYVERLVRESLGEAPEILTRAD